MDTTKMWDYRVVRRESEDGSDEWYSIQEIYYDDETGEPVAQTIDLQVEGDTITGMRTQLEQMLQSLKESVLDESDIIPTSDVETDSEVDVPDYYTSDNYAVIQKSDSLYSRGKYIYESPDGGKTLYRRKFGEKIRENMEKPDFNDLSISHDLSGEEIDGMYTDDEVKEWDEIMKNSEDKGL